MLMSKKNTFKSALSYEGKILENYKYQLHIQNEILKIIKSSIPFKLSHHVLYCVVSEKKVLVYTNSAAWSSQLRFYHQQMYQALLMSNYTTFETLKIKIIPPTIAPNNHNKPTIIPSAKHINLLREQAENQPDEALKKALLNLAKTFKELSSPST